MEVLGTKLLVFSVVSLIKEVEISLKEVLLSIFVISVEGILDDTDCVELL